VCPHANAQYEQPGDVRVGRHTGTAVNPCQRLLRQLQRPGQVDIDRPSWVQPAIGLVGG
jgi:hypothetical protein